MSGSCFQNPLDLTGESHNIRQHQFQRTAITGDDREFIDIEDYDFLEDEPTLLELPEQRRRSTRPLRNPPIRNPFRVVDSYAFGSAVLCPGNLVETVGGDFLLIKFIVRNDETQSTTFRGLTVQRCKDMNGMLFKKLNEAVIRMEIDLDDPRDAEEQSMVEISQHELLKYREVRLTNRKFRGWRTIKNGYRPEEALELFSSGGFTIRWLFLEYYGSSRQRRNNEKSECVLLRLPESKCTPNYTVREDLLRSAWRGNTVAGGSYITRSPDESYLRPINPGGGRGKRKLEDESHYRVRYRNEMRGLAQDRATPIDLTRLSISPPPPESGEILSHMSKSALDLKSSRKSSRSQKYTFGDAFCGAGGATRGALMAGLKVVWGFDCDTTPYDSWKQNFPDASSYCLDASEFCIVATALSLAEFKIDILHLSPPCQYFSPAHARDGVNDDWNTASLFAIKELLRVSKPRVVTLEQTSGLTGYHRCIPYFNALILMFTEMNFSVRWKVINLVDWGLPGRRRRLILIASCPGEPLPQMPTATHGPGLKPYVTVNQALQGIQTNPISDPEMKLFSQPRAPWDADRPMGKAITCNGGQDVWHQSGTRKFTLRESAALQGFPPTHTFVGCATKVRRQIGNAVPPCIAKVLFESVVKDLKRVDGVVDDGSIIID